MRRNKNIFRGNGAPIPDSLSLIRSFHIDTNPTRPVRPSPLTASTIPDLPLDLLDKIRTFPLFASAPDSFLVAIGKHLRPQVNASHDIILTEGDDARAMYWLVRGAVAVTSRDGEAIYAELKPGSFFGEIGILMDVPRTATVIARTKCLLVVLKKEDLRTELPNFPDMEKAIMEEAQERLTILNRKRKESGQGIQISTTLPSRTSRLKRESTPADDAAGSGTASSDNGSNTNHKKRKSPSPGHTILDPSAGGSALASGFVNVRQTLTDLPLFSTLPPDILHFLGLSAQPRSYPPFTDIIKEGSLGSEIYFIVRGEAEVIRDDQLAAERMETRRKTRSSIIRPRLKQGQYFGEVTSLALAPRRTATVRSITAVECLTISGDVLDELWRRCPPDIRQQVEVTGKMRLGKSKDSDVPMMNTNPSAPSLHHLEIGERPPSPSDLPQVTFTPSRSASPLVSNKIEGEIMEPSDFDPFLSVDMEEMRARQGRRSSMAPPADEDAHSRSLVRTQSSGKPSKLVHTTTPPDCEPYRMKRPRTIHQRRPSQHSKGRLPDGILVQIYRHLDIYQLMRLREVSLHWSRLLSHSPQVCQVLDLSLHNRTVTDHALVNAICPFAGQRPRLIDISNCFHITDIGFNALNHISAQNTIRWNMKSVWDISANAVLDMANNAKNLEEIDLSNCRKVSDNLLARIIGWVVTQQNPRSKTGDGHLGPPIGTVVGCPRLKRLTLSYCKHVTDRSMAHIAVHAHDRLQAIDLTRCTTIGDAGFQHWSIYKFAHLEKLVLADCTYLTDNAIVYLTNAAKWLKHLDLSFCCALSDTATEVLSLGLPCLQTLRLSFCGSAVSDSSLRSIGLHLLELRELSVRGCVRVTGVGVEAVVEGCHRISIFDVSQCKNLSKWLSSGGIETCLKRWKRDVTFLTEKLGDGSFR